MDTGMVAAMTLETMLEVWHWVARHWAFLAIVFTCASLLLFVVILLAKYIRISLNIFTDTPLPVGLGVRDFQVMQGEEVRFRSYDGTSLRGMWLRTPNRAACKGAIVFCHEFGSDMYSCARYARPLVNDGFDVFTFDFRAHGGSSTPNGYKPLQWPSEKEMEDALGACAFVEDALVAAEREPKIGLFGISMGAGAGILAASSDPNIAAIVCDGAFSTKETCISLMKRWAYIFARVKLVYENHPDAFWGFLIWCILKLASSRLGRRFPSVRGALADMVSRPIMLIHGQRDSYINPNQAQLLHDAAPGPKYIWIVPKAKHNQSVVVVPQEYADRTTAFFRKYLSGENVAEEGIRGESAKSVVA